MSTAPSWRRLGERLLAMGASVVAIKLGDQGLYVRTSADAPRVGRLCERLGLDADAWCGREILAPCFVPHQVAGTTGSGDATIAGLLAALLRGADPISAATAATAVGGCSVEALDPTSAIPDWETIAARVAAGWRRAPVTIELGPERASAVDAAGTLSLGR